MAALNFPNSPSTNDLHTENGVTFKWNGTIWKRVSSAYTDATNLNVTGLSTFVGNAQFDANVSVGGVLTYEDVKNVDSVGIVTARAGIKVPDDQRIRLGAANDLDIYHTTSGTSWIRHGNTSEYFVIEGDQMDFRSYTNSHYRVRMGTAVELRHNNIERLKTSSTGVTITGGIVISEDNAIHFRGTAADDADAILRQSAGGGQLLINSRNDTILNIDSNNDSTDAHFAVAHGAATGSSSELFRVQEDGKIGINTTNPYTALEVQGHGGTNDATITFTRHGSPGNGGIIGQNFYRIGTDSVAAIGAYRESAMDDAYLAFHTQVSGGSFGERFRIKSDGIVLVGTTTPAHWDNRRFTIAHTGDNFLELRGGSSNGCGIIFSDGTGNSTAGYPGYIFYSHADDSMRFHGGGSGNERVRIDSNGYLGVNNTSPSTRLDVKQDNGVAYNGNAQSIAYNAARFLNTSGHTSGGTYTGFQFNITGDSQNRICSIGMISEASNSKASSLVFHTDDGGNRTEKLRIHSTGGVGIGTDNFAGELDNRPGLAIHSNHNDSCRLLITTPTKSPTRLGYFGLNRFGVDVQHGFEIRDVAASYATRLLIDNGGRIRIGRTNKAVAKGALIIDNESRNAMSDRSDPDKYGIVLCGSSTTNEGNGIAFCNDNAQNTAAAIIAVDRGSNNLGDLRFYTKDEGSPSGGPKEGFRINQKGSWVGATGGFRNRDDIKVAETYAMPQFHEGYSTSNDTLSVAASMFHQTHVRGTSHLTTELFSTKMGGNGGMYVQVEVWFSSAVGNYQGYQMLWANVHRTSWNNFTINHTGQEGNKLGSDTTGYFNLTYNSSGSGANQRLTWKVVTSFGNNYVRCLYKTTCLGHDYFQELTVIR